MSHAASAWVAAQVLELGLGLMEVSDDNAMVVRRKLLRIDLERFPIRRHSLAP